MDSPCDGLSPAVICRGYEDKFAIMREVAKASISVKIGKHIQDIISELKKDKGL